MNEAQEKVKKFMDLHIDELYDGLDNLKDHKCQPTGIGELYNGMLKHTITFEAKHMENLKDELLDLLS